MPLPDTPLIDIGDLTLSTGKGAKQEKLFHAVRGKVVSGLWPKGGKLPSTRELAKALSLSRNTIIGAYEHLLAEGYIESRQGSGYFVSVELPEHYLLANKSTKDSATPLPMAAGDINRPFAPGIPDLAKFPYTKWQKLLQRHASRPSLLGNQSIQGSEALRSALSNYLATSRSVLCNPGRIIITAGAQQALSIALMATMKKQDTVLMEHPGYIQARKIISLMGYGHQAVEVKEHSGLDIQQVVASDAKALYVTPSNQYPMGTTLNTEDRLQLIDWAVKGKRWIIEDDYDSEFQFAHRPYTSMQGLAGQMGWDNHVIYVGSFSKVMFNGLRLGYLVVPESLVPTCLMIKDAVTGDSPTHTQAALADFISEGDLLRHIRKMRRLYKAKHQMVCESVEQHFNGDIEVISQAAGLHVTLKWHTGIDENTWVARANDAGITIRALNYYEQAKSGQRGWHSVVLGFGNIALDEINTKIKLLSRMFYQ
ncbi:PLP-dependent aminotransferase family protein [Photobacterium satsumensis]|uniref:MocR-like pyridoxine biosynthesis transcription factor PdxR n=1 Tax=Photobacterium satsumensis TaxID=2910239 RepID=UPI003D12EB50